MKMPKVMLRPLVVLGMALGTAWLVGCSSTPKPPPKGADGYSKYGNPNSYEVLGERYSVMRDNRGYKETGIASWYGPGFHGKRASAGETYDQNAMTAAHKTLRIPCYVEVTNLQNGRKVVLRVNDRGPFHDNRIIDLSKAAAEKLGVIATGTAMVEVRHIDGDVPSESLDTTLQAMEQTVAPPLVPRALPAPTPSVIFSDTARPVPEWGRNVYVQLGAFTLRPNAEQLRSKLELANIRGVNVVQKDDGLFRVRIGPLASVDDADALATQLDAAGVGGRHMVIE
ncbi:MAG TPA: septal ring lytic transglycosylase RlpA family protein [bacterium]|nr:septal ring lytic transglycosylase RlpA family protein [bacterium]